MTTSCDAAIAAPIETIRAELKAPTPQTLRYLRSILGLDSIPGTGRKALSSQVKKTPLRSKPCAFSRPPVKPACRRPAKSSEEPRVQETSNISEKDRLKIATETFNITIKRLGEAVQTLKDVSKYPNAAKEPPGRCQSSQALHDQSPNRRKRRPALSPKNLEDPTRHSNLELTVECSYAALQGLHKCGVAGSDIQLEKGSLILLERAISLKLATQALRQLFEIHHTFWGIQVSHDPCASSMARVMLVPPDAVESDSTFAFADSVQGQALRLALLLGSKCLGSELVKILQPDTVGSPVWVIIEGLRQGRIRLEQAVMKLQVTTRAISKLYVQAVSSSQEASAPTDAYELFYLSLRIKFEAWRMRRHAPDPIADVWRPLQNAVATLCASTTGLSSSFERVIQSLNSTCEFLLVMKCEPEIPPELFATLLGALNTPEEFTKLASLLDEIQDTAGNSDLVRDCQITTARLKAFPQDLPKTLSSIWDIQGRLTQRNVVPEAECLQFLRHLSQLRKATIALIMMQSPEGHEAEARSSQQLQHGLFSLTRACFIYLESNMATVLGQTPEIPQKESEKAFLITFMMTVEAILSLSNCDPTGSSELVHIAWDSLKDCSKSLQALQTNHAPSLARNSMEHQCRQLRIRISQLFWSRYLTAMKRHESILEQAAILELSVQNLLQLPASDQRTACTPLKFERLAYCYLEANKPDLAIPALRHAIAASIAQGILGEVAESLLSGPFHLAWSQRDSSWKAFGKVLATLGKTTVARSAVEGSKNCFYDDPLLPAVQRAVLLEKQLLAAYEADLDNYQRLLCKETVSLLFQLLEPPKYRVYRMRLTNHLLCIALRKGTSAPTFAVEANILQDLLRQVDLVGDTIVLQKYEREIVSLLSLQYGSLTGVPIRPLEEDLIRLKSIIAPCRQIRGLESACEDPVAWIAPLLLASDYAVMVEDPQTAIMALGILEHLAGFGINTPALCRKSISVRKSGLELQLQDILSASKSLAVAEADCKNDKIDSLVEVDFALAYSEHYLNIVNLEECSRWLHQAKDLWLHQHTTAALSLPKSKLKEQSLLCKAAQLASRLAFEQNLLGEAVVLARQSCKIAASIWHSLERVWIPTPVKETVPATTDVHNLSAEFSKLGLSGKRLPAGLVAMSSVSHITLCCATFIHMAVLQSHCGVYHDATTFYEQALSIARKTGQSMYELIALSGLNVLHARAGHTEKARSGLQLLSMRNSKSRSEWLQAFMCISQGEAYVALGDLKTASSLLAKAKHTRPELGPSHEDRAVRCKTKTLASRQKPNWQKGNVLLEASTSAVRALTTPPLELREIRGRISALEARLRSLGANDDDLTASDRISCEMEDRRTLVWVAADLIQSALKLFSEDPIHNVLAETAVALPVRYRSARNGGRVSFVHSSGSGAHAIAGGRSMKQTSEKGTLAKARTLFNEAHDLLQPLVASQSSQLSSDIVHTCHKLLTQTTLLSTVLSQPMTPSSLNVLRDITSPLDVVCLRETYITLGEVASARMTSAKEWPTIKDTEQEVMRLISETASEYDPEVLPASWSVVSLVLNESKTELFVACLARSRSPFVVRIPLARPDPSDGDPDGFDLERARAEMQEIVRQANLTAHDTRGSSTDKSMRASWFAERQDLDRQLSALLDSIENVWLGGFRGLLSGHRTDEHGLANFGRSLSSTLNKHLPSRKKKSRSSGPRIELHHHVLDLFVGLGHPRAMDLDDAVTDLLYFVVDILQFNGEPNAYDEIDFDAMLVDVLDALHAYHDARRDVSPGEEAHVVLVLDKELQIFPWESLPCLRGTAVSRMPSLGSVWERLKAMREQSFDSNAYKLSRTKGSYILNPSSDLKSTQQTFGQLFDTQLPDYKAIVNRPPEAHEFETVLRERDLVLYFGHGGGGQYIRPRAIRKMENCAVTLLMGCSSAKLTECGVYEPYGMPLSYMSGGSPAVVGTLWDVTDRDIDRFALKLMEDWGLVRGDSRASAQSVRKSKEKEKVGKVMDDGGPFQPVSLDQAMANARETCVLKYLNGAAPVMYGIPVLLD